MILVCREGLGPTRVEEIRDVLARRGLETALECANGRTLLTVCDEPGMTEDIAFDRIPGIQAVIPTVSPHPLAARRVERERTIVPLGQGGVGDGSFAVIAGPCAVESREQMGSAAEAVRDAGGSALRGGAYKPRTSPYSFRGLGAEGLEILAEARASSGLPIVTEVLDPRDVEPVGAVADMLQVGSRNMSNAALLREVGAYGSPVLLKRGMAATLKEFLLAAETLLGSGTDEVVLCERGIRSFDGAVRNVLDISAVPALRLRTHLPILIDPSHGAGIAALVPSLAMAAAAVGADGILIEVHPRPEDSRSDGNQAILTDELAPLVARCRAVSEIARRDAP